MLSQLFTGHFTEILINYHNQSALINAENNQLQFNRNFTVIIANNNNQ